MSTLVTRILDCVPAGTYGMHALFRLVDVVESEEVETAAVQGGDQPRMLVNPRFVERHAATPERLLMLVMHELHHVILGHTRLVPVATRLDNLVFDAVINALLCRAFPDPRAWAFFTDLYPEDSFPGAVLRPAPGWTPNGTAVRNPHLARVAPRLANAHGALYTPDGVAYEELRRALLAACPPEEAAVLLLGDHRADALLEGDLERRAPGLLDAVRHIVEAWPQPPEPIRGRSVGAAFREAFAPPARTAGRDRRALRALLAWAGEADRHGVHRKRALVEQPALAPMRSRARRDVVLDLLGSPILLHEGRTAVPGPVRAGERVHVYLDVSGSVSGILSALTGAVTDCADVVHPVVHAFSDDVADLTLADLRTGRVRTTGGTDIACVAAHARRHRVRRAVVITDGWVGTPGRADARTLREMRLGAAWTARHSTDDLGAFVGRSTVLGGAA